MNSDSKASKACSKWWELSLSELVIMSGVLSAQCQECEAGMKYD